MRTTLDIEVDILAAAKELAAKEKTTAGRVLSQLARRGLSMGHPQKSAERNGIEMLPVRDEAVSVEHVRNIMDAEGI
jgi:hypothetical protein